LRLLALPLLALCTMHLWSVEAPGLPVRAWIPLACLTVAAFYANRALRREDIHYGYAAAAVLALASGHAAPAHEAGGVWFVIAGVLFLLGWLRRLPDFRCQGYAIACLAVAGTMFAVPRSPVSTAIGAAVSCALALAALRSREESLPPAERSLLFAAATTAAALGLAAVLYDLLPGSAVGAAWGAEAMFLAWAAAWGQPFWASAGLPLGVSRDNAAPGAEALRLPLGAGAASRVSGVLFWQSAAVGIAAFARCWAVNLDSHEALPAAAGIACLYGAQLLSPRDSNWRIFHSLAATALLAIALYYEVSGSVLTVAWGVEGLALLGAGFPLRDRTLRLSGLALLLACILKLFIYDLSYLDTLPRIFSFIALGLILVGVSWIYTRFRERVRKFL
jgi:hypothetical protein